MTDWRKTKLFINLTITAVVFTYFLLILIMLLNPHVTISSRSDFFLLFKQLLIFYGPLWFIITGIIFIISQFFAEKKYPIGIFSPPTITYFLSFTVLIVSVIFYFNYDYYLVFFAHNIKAKFIQILLVNLVLIVAGIFFVFSKKIKRKWSQALFLAILALNILNSYSLVVSDSTAQNKTTVQTVFPKKIPSFPVTESKAVDESRDESASLSAAPGSLDAWETSSNLTTDNEEAAATEDRNPAEKSSSTPTQRRIRVLIMDGLSLQVLQSMATDEKLLNFRYILNKGVYGNFTTFAPNLDLSMINTALTGLRPAEYIVHTNSRYKFWDLHYEFDVFPRYILFRNSSILGITSFYDRTYANVIDNIDKYYENNNYRTLPLLNPSYIPRFAKRSLSRKSSFMLRFADILKTSDRKYEILKKAFFFDDFIKGSIPILKDSNFYYGVMRLPGLAIISKYFYQYYNPTQLFSHIPEAHIKKYGPILGKYYDYYDSILGNLLTTTGENELLVIISFFEYKPLPVWRRVLVNLYGKKDIYVYKSLNSPGTILLYENNALKKGYPMKTISILDIFPTLIYYAGFPLSKNIHGQVIQEIFTEEFQLNNPIDINININTITTGAGDQRILPSIKQ